MAALREAFRDYEPDDPDGTLEWRFMEDCPTPSRGIDYSYPTALVDVVYRDRAWWNLWKGRRYLRTHFDFFEDFGSGFRTRVRRSRAEDILPRLEQVEAQCGVTFSVEVG
jgi:hypothetical protein